MEIEITKTAEKELEKMPSSLNVLFGEHIQKIVKRGKRKHLKHGLPYFVEKITKQARAVYVIEENQMIIHHCFKTHKEYAKWYKSFT